jgi:hypothetical protein
MLSPLPDEEPYPEEESVSLGMDHAPKNQQGTELMYI